MNQDTIYITGHQHPDTDSIAADIAYSYFKNQKGFDTHPCRLGEVNNESKYLLDRFGFEEPELLLDARKSLCDIKLEKPLMINPDMTVAETLTIMKENDTQSLAVVDEDKKLIGMVTKSDLTDIGLSDASEGIELLKNTPVSHIAKTVAGELVYDDELVHLNGKVSIIAATQAKLANYEIADRIVIIGDDSEGQMEIIRKGAGMLIIVWAKNVSKEVIEEAKKYHCPVVISGHGSMNTSRFVYTAVPVKLIMSNKVVTFNQKELVEEAGKKMTNYRYRAFPVVDDDDHLIGYVTRDHAMNYTNKNIILVDHNEFAQSVKAIEKAQILEVIDHHRVNDFRTGQPLLFSAEIIGSTSTIITKIFKENDMTIPANYAGLLLGAILSDTLMFQSPTTTSQDKEEAAYLAGIAGLDIQTFGKEMFEASADIGDKSLKDLINGDIKSFEIGSCKSMISQIIIPTVSLILNRADEMQETLDAFTAEKNLDLCVVAVTGIVDKGSIFFMSGNMKDVAYNAYPNKEGEKHSLQDGVLSRKKQIVPAITNALLANN